MTRVNSFVTLPKEHLTHFPTKQHGRRQIMQKRPRQMSVSLNTNMCLQQTPLKVLTKNQVPEHMDIEPKRIKMGSMTFLPKSICVVDLIYFIFANKR